LESSLVRAGVAVLVVLVADWWGQSGVGVLSLMFWWAFSGRGERAGGGEVRWCWS